MLDPSNVYRRTLYADATRLHYVFAWDIDGAPEITDAGPSARERAENRTSLFFHHSPPRHLPPSILRPDGGSKATLECESSKITISKSYMHYDLRSFSDAWII